MMGGFYGSGLGAIGQLPVQYVVRYFGERSEISGLSSQDLADFIDLPEPTAGELAILNGYLQTAIEKAVWFTGYEPSEVAAEIRYDVRPVIGRGAGGLIPSPPLRAAWFELPRRPLLEVTGVTVDENPIDMDRVAVDTFSNPPRVSFDSDAGGGGSFAVYKISCTFSPGEGGVDPRFITGVLLYAGYLYDNRGCSTGTAFKESGAKDILRTLRIKGSFNGL